MIKVITIVEGEGWGGFFNEFIYLLLLLLLLIDLLFIYVFVDFVFNRDAINFFILL